MYEELHRKWEEELTKPSLVKLPPDFYSKLADYMQRIKVERRMLDRRTVKARLLRDETRNAKKMIFEIAQMRYRKLSEITARGERIPEETLAQEEKGISASLLPPAETYQDFVRNMLQGRLLKLESRVEQSICAIRFLADVPAVMGADLKTYGPFKAEDLASLPIDNSKILIGQGLAEEVNLG